MFARQLIYALESFGIHIFPNSRTCFHFDDKLAQKYLLEAVNAPLADTWIFYSIESANAWISTTAFPKVFKLRTGAGSSNVRLVHTPDEAYRLVNVAFSYGFNPVKGYFSDFSTRIRKTHSLNAFFTKLLRAPSVVKDLINKRNIYPPERGYIYFQEFLPGNLYDTRVTVIGNRAFAFIRYNRPGDFRASGSGLIDHRPESIDIRIISEAFRIADSIGSQSLAMDFVYDTEQNPRLLEISYAYVPDAVYDCPGHWDSALNWHQGHVWPQDAILNDIIHKIYRADL
ncbi:MAG: hypothetical protein HPY84_12210 [Syntrophobacteraceae bacterium]|nr:hypothetical protein [Syntrophobacteraceae bacterium]